MKIFTSYFAHISKLPNNIVPVSIALSPPKGYYGLSYRKLAPTWNILSQYKNNPNEEMYTKRYYEEILSKLNVHQVINELSKISDDKDIALTCFEKKESFCHRHIVAQWLIDNGYDCREAD